MDGLLMFVGLLVQVCPSNIDLRGVIRIALPQAVVKADTKDRLGSTISDPFGEGDLHAELTANLVPSLHNGFQVASNTLVVEVDASNLGAQLRIGFFNVFLDVCSTRCSTHCCALRCWSGVMLVSVELQSIPSRLMKPNGYGMVWVMDGHGNPVFLGEHQNKLAKIGKKIQKSRH